MSRPRVAFAAGFVEPFATHDHHAHPIDGLIAVVDVTTAEVLDVPGVIRYPDAVVADVHGRPTVLRVPPGSLGASRHADQGASHVRGRC